MSDSSQTAIRVGDDILHSDALFGGVLGIIGGAVIGLAVGALIVGGTIATGGALAVVVGATLLGGGLGGGLGKILGSHHSAGAKGKVLTGSPNVFLGYDKKPAARADADVAHCEEHSDSEPAHDQPAVLGKKIAQGSEHVLINGYYAARKGDKGTCDFKLGDGWPTIVIGGPPQTVAGLSITSETASIDGLILGMTIVGGALLMVPAGAAIIAGGLEAGLGWGAIGGQMLVRLGGQVLLGMGLSTAGGMGFGYVGGQIWGQGSLGQDLSSFVGQVAVPFAGAVKIPGVGESAYGLIDGIPAFGNRAGVVPDVPGVSDVPGDQRYGGTGAEPEFTSTQAEQAQANAAYDQIRANDDVAQVAQNTGHSPETIQAVKDHLFNSQQDIFNPETGETSSGNFTPDQGTADLWNKAADGSLGQPRQSKWGTPIEGTENPVEVAQFNKLIAHEYVEQGLVSDGLPYQVRSSWVQDANGEWQYQPGPDSFGAHDLSPNFREDPFSHYESLLGRSSEGIPRPNETNSNLDDVLAGVRRSLGEGGGPEGGIPSGGGPEGGPRTNGSSGRGPPQEPFVPARPLPPNPPEGRPVTPAPDAEPLAAPGEDLNAGIKPEVTAPLAETVPEGAAPEPAPGAAAPDFTGRLRGENVTLPGVKTRPLAYTKRAEADLTALRSKFDSSARYEKITQGMDPRPVAENRSNFLKGLANDAGKTEQLKTAGISDKGIELMKQGKLPSKAWQVHHKLPLDDGGTNAPDNLVLIKNDPFHQVITNEQNALITNLSSGETLNIPNWPVPDGFVYPPKP